MFLATFFENVPTVRWSLIGFSAGAENCKKYGKSDKFQKLNSVALKAKKNVLR